MEKTVNQKQNLSKLDTDGLLDVIRSQRKQLDDFRKHDLSDFVFGKETPNSYEAEKAVIGACLIVGTSFKIAQNILKSEDFYNTLHQLIYRAFETLTEKKTAIDYITVTEFLMKKHKKELDDNGGAYAIIEASNNVATSANLEYHARIVKQHAIARNLIAANSKSIKDIYEGQKDIFDIAEELKNASALRSLNPIFVGGTATKIMELAKTAKDIKNIFGNIFKTGDLTLFMAPKKTGKTIIGYQIADAISKGNGMFNNMLDNSIGESKVLYIDMEMNLSDFKERYINAQSKKEYTFSKNLHIQMLNPTNFDFEQGKMLNEIEKLIIETKPNVLIIDNLTALMKSISDADSALIAIRTLLALKHEHDLSIMIMCHTPKKIGNLPLSSDDILGSGIFLNLCTSVFGIRRSFTEKGIVYLKHLDTRNSQLIYDDENVILMSIQKIDNFTEMMYEGQAKEADHLAKKGSEEEAEIWNEAIKLYNSGKSWAKIKTELNYQYTPQMLQKSCIKYAERTQSYIYIASQQKFADWFDLDTKDVTEVTEVTNVPIQKNLELL